MATLKLGLLGDIHYGSSDVLFLPYRAQYQTQALAWASRFVARMAAFGPDVVGSMGDNSTAANAGEKTSLLTAVVSKMAEVPAAQLIALGNHDFEYATPAEVQAALSALTYFESGKLYGSFDLGTWHIVVLDSNYADTTPFAHLSANGGVGHGYIPDGAGGSDDQMGWLTADLAATSSPTIVVCHASLEEYDGSTFYSVPTSDFDRYSVSNRADVRSVLEASGKVVVVLEGHQHFGRACTVNGIPYLQIPSLVGWGVYPNRLATATDQGQWAEVVLDDVAHTIRFDLYEDDSTVGAQRVVSRLLSFPGYGPYATYASGFAAQIGTGLDGNTSYDGGELTHWTVVTVTANYAPTTGILAHARSDEPLRLVWKRTAAAGAASSATRRVAPQAATFNLTIAIQLAQATERLNVHLQSSGGVAGPSVAFDASGNLVTAAGAVLTTYEAATEYALTFVVDVVAGTYDVLLNSVEVGTGIAFASAVTDVDRLQVEWPSGETGTAYLGPMFIGTGTGTGGASSALRFGGTSVTLTRGAASVVLAVGS